MAIDFSYKLKYDKNIEVKQNKILWMRNSFIA